MHGIHLLDCSVHHLRHHLRTIQLRPSWALGHRTYHHLHADGQLRTGPQNAFCVVIFVLLIIAIYVAYLFKSKFEKEIEENFVGEGY
jgi:hypothetical protein